MLVLIHCQCPFKNLHLHESNQTKHGSMLLHPRYVHSDERYIVIFHHLDEVTGLLIQFESLANRLIQPR